MSATFLSGLSLALNPFIRTPHPLATLPTEQLEYVEGGSMAGEQGTESQRAESFIERLAEKMGIAARAVNIFGPAVEREGITVIPVAKIRYGFGGGSGRRDEQEGSGGGGGVQASPVGFIEVKNGSAGFRPIGPAFPWAPLAVGTAIGFIIFRRYFG